MAGLEGSGAAFDMETKEYTMILLDGEQTAKKLSCVDLFKPSDYDK